MTIKKLPKAPAKKQFSFLQSLYLSWYSKEFYIDVYTNWRKHFILFLMCVSLAIGIPVNKRVYNNLKIYVTNEIKFPIDRMPKLVIQHGVLLYPKNKQIFIKNKNNQTAIIIDTKNRIRSLPDKKYPEAFLLLNKHSWSILLSPNEWAEYVTPVNTSIKQQYDQRDLEIIDKGAMIDQNFFKKAMYIINFSIIPATTIVLFSIFITFILFFSLFGKLLSSVLFKFEITIKQSTRIALMSSIPTLWCFFILAIHPFEMKFIGILSLLLMPFYYNFAIFHIKKHLKIKTRGIIGRLINFK